MESKSNFKSITDGSISEGIGFRLTAITINNSYQGLMDHTGSQQNTDRMISSFESRS